MKPSERISAIRLELADDMGGTANIAPTVRRCMAIERYLDEQHEATDLPKPPEGALQRAADALGVDLESDDEDSFGKTSEAMQHALDCYRNEESAMLACNEEIEEWIESVGMAEADASRYQDVCDVLAKYGVQVDHANGEDAHQLVEELCKELLQTTAVIEHHLGAGRLGIAQRLKEPK